VQTVGLSMIVKNGAATLRPCLESVQGAVSQIVIADTGSTDTTCEIAQEFGASIIQVPWENHFANARNAALQAMTSDWVLVLDADEELDADAAKRIPELLQRSDVGGYVTPIRNYVPSRFTRAWDRTAVPNDHSHARAKDAPAFVVHENCRLFRRQPEVYFTGRVHEAVEDQVKGTGLKLVLAPFYIHHFGQLSTQALKNEKTGFYRDLLRLKAEERPTDPLTWMQLGLHEFEFFGNAEEALSCLDRALVLEPRASDGWIFKGMILVSLGRPQDALIALRNARAGGRGGALCEQLRGDALSAMQQLDAARVAYREALKLNPSDPIVESKLGFTELRLGHQTGLSKLKRAAEAAPGVLEIQDRLIKAYVFSGMLPEAADTAERLILMVAHPKLFLRAASLCAKLEQWERVLDILTRGLEMFPDSAELLNARVEVEAMRIAHNRAEEKVQAKSAQ
jgi:tetratricopeptide (TPR) repeat protein